jgi:aspartyl-tRNA synthetase
VHEGSFYALPQSPQLYKQLLMVAGYDRYVQIARCFRDEDLRADRQPEFTQIDIEMSFITPDDIYRLVEGMMARVFAVAGRQWPESIPRLSYDEAMARYGSDRPDLRYGLPIVDVTEAARALPFPPFASLGSSGVVRGIALPAGAATPRREIDELTEGVRRLGATGLVWIKRGEDGVTSSALKHLGEQATLELAGALGAGPGSLALLAAGPGKVVAGALGWLRQDLARRGGLVPADRDAILWVERFPLFDYDDAAGRWVSCHHPFTSPRPEDLALLDSDPGQVRSQAYDLVMNGWELGGGSIRIHDADLQRRVLSRLGLSDEEISTKFGFFVQALAHGAPPHGGIALGLDRIVALLTGATSLRDVIAFPKTTSSADLMTGSPSEVAEAQLRELGFQARPDQRS